MRVEGQQMVSAKKDSKTNQRPWFDWKSSLPPQWEKRDLPSSMLSLLPGQPEGGGGQTAGVELGSNRRGVNSSIDRSRAVRFDSVVKMILVPSRLDLSDGLSDELWWNDEDYLRFRCGTINFCVTYRSTAVFDRVQVFRVCVSVRVCVFGAACTSIMPLLLQVFCFYDVSAHFVSNFSVSSVASFSTGWHSRQAQQSLVFASKEPKRT